MTNPREAIERLEAYVAWMAQPAGPVFSAPYRHQHQQKADDLSTLIASHKALVEALSPFAAAADIRLCADETYWTDDKSIQQTDVAHHVKFGHLRAARAILNATGGQP
jgi:hypothetical protein